MDVYVRAVSFWTYKTIRPNTSNSILNGKIVRTNTKYNPVQLIRDHSRMVQDAKTRPRLRVTL